MSSFINQASRKKCIFASLHKYLQVLGGWFCYLLGKYEFSLLYLNMTSALCFSDMTDVVFMKTPKIGRHKLTKQDTW